MTAKKKPDPAHREAVRRFRKACQHEANRRALVFMQSHPDMAAAVPVVHVEAALYAFFSEFIEPTASTPDGLKWAAHCKYSRTGVISGIAQKRGALQPRFEAFALALHDEHPAMTKTEIRRRYLDAHSADKRSANTIKRYCTGLWKGKPGRPRKRG